MKGLYVITDCARLSTDRLLSVTEQVLRAGVAALQYRDKSGDRAQRAYEATRLRQLCHQYGCPLIINDDLELAISVKCDGVHLGKDDIDCKTARKELGPRAIIGISCYNSLQRAVSAQEHGADYVAFGAFFPSLSKQHAVSAEPEIISQAKAQLTLPIAAIGGITPTNCGTLIEHGADMLAVISSVYQSEDPHSVVQEFNRHFAFTEDTGTLSGKKPAPSTHIVVKSR